MIGKVDDDLLFVEAVLREMDEVGEWTIVRVADECTDRCYW